MGDHDGKVIVYRSEMEKNLDYWMWHGGGWSIIIAVAVILLLTGLVSLWIKTREENPQRQFRRRLRR